MRSGCLIAAPPPIAEDAQQRIDALTRRFEQLEARLSVLEARRPRDAEDERLRQLLPEADTATPVHRARIQCATRRWTRT